MTQNMKLPCTRLQLDYIQLHLEPNDRVVALLDAADCVSGKRYRELTAGLSRQNSVALTIGPAFVGGDSSDMDVFVTEFWKRPVTDDNLNRVVRLFKLWYQTVAPDEYHAPQRLPSMQEMGY